MMVSKYLYTVISEQNSFKQNYHWDILTFWHTFLQAHGKEFVVAIFTLQFLIKS